jgi:PAS domain S-box-containing protein
MVRFLSSLRVRLAGLVLFVALPTLALVLHQDFQQRRLVERQGLAEAGRLSDQASRDIEQAVRDARTLLDLLAGLPEVRRGDPAVCTRIFRDLLEQDRAGSGDTAAVARGPASAGDPSRYANLGLADLTGNVIASALPMSGPVNLADRFYFRRALATGTFAVGEYQVGRITRTPTLNVARPVPGPHGRPGTVIYAAIGLGWLSAVPAGRPLARGAVFSVVDHRGTVLARHPDPGRWVGRAFPNSPVLRAIQEGRDSAFEALGADGVRRLWSFRPIGGPAGASAYGIFGLDRRQAFAEADQAMARSLLLLALVLLVALLAAWLGAQRFVLRPVDRVIATARRLRAGEMDARTGMTGPGELDDLGRFFDAAAQSLEDRQQELERTAVDARRSYETLRAMITASPVAIVVLDQERRTIVWNPAAERLFGWSAAEIVGQVQPPYIPPEERVDSYDLAGRALGGDQLMDVEVQRIRRDGTRLELSLSAAPIAGPDGAVQGIVGVYMDLTARRQLERQLHHAQKMEALGRLAGGVAHDFNNLLTVIQGFSEMTLKRDGLPAEARRDVEEVHKAARRAADLIGQLLAFSRRQPVQPRIMELNTIVADMTRMLQRLIGETIQLDTRLGHRLGRVRVDPGQIEQVLANLVVNARDAMPHGGKLLVETGSHDCGGGARPRCRPGCPGPSTTLTVTDTGVGMDAATLQHVFEPFYTTKPRGRGTGLGLSTIYGIVQQSGGDIEVVSAPGAGTRFRIYLPVADAADVEGGTAAAAVGEPRGAGTILLVEDEDDVRGFVSSALGHLGYRVLVTRHGEEALAVAAREPAIDLLLTDVVMPGLGGPEVARRLGEMRPGTRVLYISGYAPVQNGSQAEPPLSPLLCKPFSLDELARRVREAMEAEA